MGHEVRETIIRTGATPPEDLPTPQRSIQQLQRDEQKRLNEGQRPSLFTMQGIQKNDSQHQPSMNSSAVIALTRFPLRDILVGRTYQERTTNPVKVYGRMTVFPIMPARINRLYELAYNLWWSWHPEARTLYSTT